MKSRILSYNDIRVNTMWSTPNPGSLVRFAMDITMKQEPAFGKKATQESLEFIFTAEHTEIVEHCVICFYIEDLSKSSLGQITRHRTAPKTSASQHYQEYSMYPHTVHPQLVYDTDIDVFFQKAEALYQRKITQGVAKEEARQVLPNAKAGNLLITFNANSLHNFFRKRMCLRNCLEVRVIADKMWVQTYEWWPELAAIVGPPCYRGKCTQGSMACGKRFIHPLVS